tara:strand:+ start:4132 stop:5229 length:1098 start_codon:yes stop_codon:yes gene_type:complete
MDNVGDNDIIFDKLGICNYYHEFKSKLKIRVPEEFIAKKELDKIVNNIKKDGVGKKYDCIIGVSGGVDSTYTALLVKRLGLRPLAVHLDNGWNSELAVKNIEKILNRLEIDLYTEVLDWEVFKDLQLSFLKASTPDGEIPTDHAILTTLYKICNKMGIKYIISGNNFRNEGMLPPSWARGYLDWKYIKSVHKLFGKQNLNTFPHMSIFHFLYYNLFKRIKSISFINYIQFDKKKAMKIIENELGWKYYGGKHYESIYTRFYQSYILTKKFNIDKRKAHLTCLIISTGEISRDEALEELRKPAADLDLIRTDKEFVLKKLNLSNAEFEDIMNLPVKSIYDYPNNHKLEMSFRKYINKLRKVKLLPN